MAESPTAREAIANVIGRATFMGGTYEGAADAVLAWLGTLSLADLAVLLSDLGYDVEARERGIASGPSLRAALVVAAKEPTRPTHDDIRTGLLNRAGIFEPKQFTGKESSDG